MNKRQTMVIFYICVVAFIVAFIVAFLSFAFYKRHEYMDLYNKGVQSLNYGNIDDALDYFDDIPNYTRYRDIAELLKNNNFAICHECGAIINEK